MLGGKVKTALLKKMLICCLLVRKVLQIIFSPASLFHFASGNGEDMQIFLQLSQFVTVTAHFVISFLFSFHSFREIFSTKNTTVYFAVVQANILSKFNFYF